MKSKLIKLININKNNMKINMKKGVSIMKFVKGMMTGMLISAGAAIMYAEYTMGPNKMMKKGKKVMKKIGLM